MARKRSEEEILEEAEPVSVVILNNIVNITEDLAETVLDLAKLQRKRPQEFKGMLENLAKAKKEGPESLIGVLPEAVAKQVMSAVMSLMMTVGSMKQAMKGVSTTSSMPFDPQKMNPDDLEKVGKALMEESAKLDKVIHEYEKDLLSAKKGKK